jgi:hypothetical protein
MPQPTRSDVHVNRPLTNISIAYIQKAEDFIADKVFPIVPVLKQSDLYFSYDKKYWFQTQATKRAPSSESAGSGFHTTTNPYFADVWAVHKDVDDQTRTNADQPIDLDRDATLFVTQQLLLRREKQFTTKYLSQSVWQGYVVGGVPVDYDVTTGAVGVQWDVSGSNPMQDVDFLKNAIKKQTGYKPNTLVVAADVFWALRNNLQVLDRIKYTQRGIVSEDLLATLFGVDKFLVASVVTDLNPEGEVNNMNYLVNNSALLVYSNPAPSILQPSGGYIFSWQGLFGAGAQGNRISEFRMEHLKSDRVEGEMAFDMHMVGADLGVYLKNVLFKP